MSIDELSHVNGNIPVAIRYDRDFRLGCEIILQSQSWNMKLLKAGGEKKEKIRK